MKMFRYDGGQNRYKGRQIEDSGNFFHIEELKVLGNRFGPKDLIAEFLIEINISLAPVAGEKLEPFRLTEIFLDLLHQLSADPLILKTRMDNQPSDKTGFLFHKRPYRPNNPSVNECFKEDLVYKIGSYLLKRLG